MALKASGTRAALDLPAMLAAEAADDANPAPLAENGSGGVPALRVTILKGDEEQ
jgi:hypothetical protein